MFATAFQESDPSQSVVFVDKIGSDDDVPRSPSSPMIVAGDHDAERRRLAESIARTKNWKRWGPYLSERQWCVQMTRMHIHAPTYTSTHTLAL